VVGIETMQRRRVDDGVVWGRHVPWASFIREFDALKTFFLLLVSILSRIARHRDNSLWRL
jgi:hypothetical protein